MRFNLDKRYFGECIPPEQCECDCGSRLNYHHWFNCATRLGLYSVNAKEPLDSSHSFLCSIQLAFEKHPMYSLLNSHRLAGGCEVASWVSNKQRPNAPKDFNSATFCLDFRIGLPYSEVFFVGSYQDFASSLLLFIETSQDKENSNGNFFIKIRKEWEFSSRSFSSMPSYSDIRINRLVNRFPNLKNCKNLEQVIWRMYDTEQMGLKQMYIEWSQAYSMYLKALEGVLTEILNSVASKHLLRVNY